MFSVNRLLLKLETGIYSMADLLEILFTIADGSAKGQRLPVISQKRHYSSHLVSEVVSLL